MKDLTLFRGPAPRLAELIKKAVNNVTRRGSIFARPKAGRKRDRGEVAGDEIRTRGADESPARLCRVVSCRGVSCRVVSHADATSTSSLPTQTSVTCAVFDSEVTRSDPGHGRTDQLICNSGQFELLAPYHGEDNRSPTLSRVGDSGRYQLPARYMPDKSRSHPLLSSIKPSMHYVSRSSKVNASLGHYGDYQPTRRRLRPPTAPPRYPPPFNTSPRPGECRSVMNAFSHGAVEL
ncbi:hypothetical protein EVAR_77103_1 [Eumeta japonica]|uniref:Uncharacterized protein n=1 Tax=Eumeta variegata TaxID=151549 RepID=A0A4C1T2I6_EUMVA|nr:hypothetical protein EVAR_77103_1 [Eumeta japonica]